MRWNRPRHNCRKLQMNRCGAKYRHRFVSGAIQMNQRHLPGKQSALRHFHYTGDAVGARNRNGGAGSVHSRRRPKLRVDQAHLLGIRGFLNGPFLQSKHGSGIDHSRVDVLTSNINGLESRRRGNPLADSNDLPVANQHRPVFNHLAGNGVNGAALQNNAPFARRLRKYQGGSQNAEANDPTMVHRHQLYPIGSQLHPFLMNDQVKKVGGVS